MARLRILKPRFFANEDLAEVSPLGRLLFQGLWCWADREGRLEDRPKRIKVEILPYDDCDVEDLLNDLAERGFIARYEVNGQHYIQVVNFTKHQSPHIKEGVSTIPAPALYIEETRDAPDEHDASTVQEPDEPPCVMGNGVMGTGFIGNGVTGGGDKPQPNEPASKAESPRKRAVAPKVTDETINLLVTEFGPQLDGEHKARDAISKARGFLKGKSWNPTRLREWLEGDVESLAMKQRNGNGHTNGRNNASGSAKAGAAYDIPGWEELAARHGGA